MSDEKTVMKRQQVVLGWLCIGLPIIAIVFGLIGTLTKSNPATWWYSISTTYYANSGVLMIGMLFATAVYLWAYKGYDKVDNYITATCAISALLTVFFPTKLAFADDFELIGLFRVPAVISNIIHNISAGVLYGTFWLMVIRFRKSCGEMTDKKKIRNILYLIAAVIMVVCGIFILLKWIFGWPRYLPIIIETVGQFCFGMAWLIKAGAFKLLND